MAQFAMTLLSNNEPDRQQAFRAKGRLYQPPELVLFCVRTPTACGTGDSAMRPFYCPGDVKLHLNPDFFDTLFRRRGAPGNVAQVDVIAHELGQDVQDLLRSTGGVDAMCGRIDGSGQQRMAWFKPGLGSGSIQPCHTFNARQI